LVGAGFAVFDEFDFIAEFELMVEFDFIFEFPAVPEVLAVVVLVVDELFAVLVVVDIVFVVVAEFVTRLALLALFAVSPPHAIPRAVKPKRADSATNFFIKSRSPVFLKDYVLLFLPCPAMSEPVLKQTLWNIG
jgi:hypothetical protein